MTLKLRQLLTLNCEESARLLSARQDRSLTGMEKTALSLHLLICRACRRYQDQIRMMRTVFRQLSDVDDADSTLSDEKRSDIKSSLRDRGNFEK